VLVRRALDPESKFEWRQGNQDRARNYRGMLAKSPVGKFNIDFEAGVDPRTLPPGEADGVARNFNAFDGELPIYNYLGRRHPGIQGVLKGLLGPEVQFHSAMALSKPAKIGGMKPWHQDVAYFSVGNWDGVCGVWIALDEATVENGCMHVLPGGHKIGPLRHEHTQRDCEIADKRLDPARTLAVPLPPGGILFFHGMIPHFTPDNNSEKRRRALQFHYRAKGNDLIPKEEFVKQFRDQNGDAAYCLAGDSRRP